MNNIYYIVLNFKSNIEMTNNVALKINEKHLKHDFYEFYQQTFC